jgi:hypothetical protein
MTNEYCGMKNSWEYLQNTIKEHNDKSCSHFWNTIVQRGIETGIITKQRVIELHDKREDL